MHTACPEKYNKIWQGEVFLLFYLLLSGSLYFISLSSYLLPYVASFFFLQTSFIFFCLRLYLFSLFSFPFHAWYFLSWFFLLYFLAHSSLFSNIYLSLPFSHFISSRSLFSSIHCTFPLFFPFFLPLILFVFSSSALLHSRRCAFYNHN